MTPPTYPKLVSDEFPCVVYYEDTDFTGFVYHANYLKFCERAREHLIGIPVLRTFFEVGLHFVVRDIHARFTSPARHGDHLIVKSEVELKPNPRLIFRQTVVRTDCDHSEKKIFIAEIHVAVLDANNKPVRLPQWAIDKIGSASI